MTVHLLCSGIADRLQKEQRMNIEDHLVKTNFSLLGS